jgi:hypothetical protein
MWFWDGKVPSSGFSPGAISDAKSSRQQLTPRNQINSAETTQNVNSKREMTDPGTFMQHFIPGPGEGHKPDKEDHNHTQSNKDHEHKTHNGHATLKLDIIRVGPGNGEDGLSRFVQNPETKVPPLPNPINLRKHCTIAPQVQTTNSPSTAAINPAP